MKIEFEITQEEFLEASRIAKAQDISLPDVFKHALLIPRDSLNWFPQFVPDNQGGHIQFNGRLWRPCDR